MTPAEWRERLVWLNNQCEIVVEVSPFPFGITHSYLAALLREWDAHESRKLDAAFIDGMYCLECGKIDRDGLCPARRRMMGEIP